MTSALRQFIAMLEDFKNTTFRSGPSPVGVAGVSGDLFGSRQFPPRNNAVSHCSLRVDRHITIRGPSVIISMGIRRDGRLPAVKHEASLFVIGRPAAAGATDAKSSG